MAILEYSELPLNEALPSANANSATAKLQAARAEAGLINRRRHPGDHEFK